MESRSPIRLTFRATAFGDPGPTLYVGQFFGSPSFGRRRDKEALVEQDIGDEGALHEMVANRERTSEFDRHRHLQQRGAARVPTAAMTVRPHVLRIWKGEQTGDDQPMASRLRSRG